MRALLSLLLLAALSACSGNSLGGLGDILGSIAGGGAPGGSQQQGQVQAEVWQVDTGNQRLHVRTQGGESGSVRFDANTEVIYRQQRYQVTNLERGDLVNLQLRQIGRNDYYVARVDVVQSVQERRGY